MATRAPSIFLASRWSTASTDRLTIIADRGRHAGAAPFFVRAPSAICFADPTACNRRATEIIVARSTGCLELRAGSRSLSRLRATAQDWHSLLGTRSHRRRHGIPAPHRRLSRVGQRVESGIVASCSYRRAKIGGLSGVRRRSLRRDRRRDAMGSPEIPRGLFRSKTHSRRGLACRPSFTGSYASERWRGAICRRGSWADSRAQRVHGRCTGCASGVHRACSGCAQDVQRTCTVRHTSYTDRRTRCRGLRTAGSPNFQAARHPDRRGRARQCAADRGERGTASGGGVVALLSR